MAALCSLPLAIMASRPSRAASIPIPMPPFNTRSLDNAISIPSLRSRISSSSSFATSPPSLTRSVPRSSSSLSRASLRQSYEPRVVRAQSSVSDLCPAPPPLTSGRRASTTGHPSRPAPRASLSSHADQPLVVVTPEVFPRPAYLEYSVFKDVLYTESPSAIPRRPAATPAQAGTPSTDSDGESSPPPRGLQSLFNPSSSQSTFALPTKWSVTDRSTHLSISQDGRDLTYAGSLSVYCLQLWKQH